VLLAGLVAGAIVYFGFFNVSAQLQDAKPLEWLLVTTREASITYHAKDIVARGPATPAQIDNGFRLFKADCAMCHSIPGGPEAMVAIGLNPLAPPLSDLVDMKDNELFWVIENGIRFTGMPGWVTKNTKDETWDLVAFLQASLAMKPEDYAAMDARVGPAAAAP